MTPEELQELRDWSARKMGWEIGVKDYPRPGGSYLYNCGENVMYHHKWQPDLDANQCFMLVERMAELGWYIDLANGPESPLWECSIFTDVSAPYKNSIIRESDNPCLAILLAARATEEQK